MEFKVGDKVKRSNKLGSVGTVIAVKTEVFGTVESKKEGILIKVRWGSGTESYFGKDGLVHEK